MEIVVRVICRQIYFEFVFEPVDVALKGLLELFVERFVFWNFFKSGFQMLEIRIQFFFDRRFHRRVQLLRHLAQHAVLAEITQLSPYVPACVDENERAAIPVLGAEIHLVAPVWIMEGAFPQQCFTFGVPIVVELVIRGELNRIGRWVACSDGFVKKCRERDIRIVFLVSLKMIAVLKVDVRGVFFPEQAIHCFQYVRFSDVVRSKKDYRFSFREIDFHLLDGAEAFDNEFFNAHMGAFIR